METFTFSVEFDIIIMCLSVSLSHYCKLLFLFIFVCSFMQHFL